MKLTTEVIRVLETAETAETQVWIPGPLLERKLYLKVNEVLEAMGGKWSRKLKVHVFPDDAAAHIETALLTGEVTTARDIGFFPTPPDLARALVQMARLKPGDAVLEPSAGTGNIVDAIVACQCAVVAVERDAKMRDALVARQADGAPLEVYKDCDDFMDCEPVRAFDAVVMNPAFGKHGKGDHLDHVRHAASMLRPGGTLVSILPLGVKFREDARHVAFHEFIAMYGDELEDLPEDSFKVSGTRVRTCVLRLKSPT